jgi:CAAX prenyl protease-like protein
MLFLPISRKTFSRNDPAPFVAPFVVFALFLVAGQLTGADPLLVYPIQTVVCGWLLIGARASYPWKPFGWRAAAEGVLAGVLVLAIWVAPQALLHLPPRIAGGFNPAPLLSGRPAWFYPATIFLRFLRLAVVVPWLEEVFWRGFLLRRLVTEDFQDVPFGTFTPRSFGIVCAGFMLEHAMADWPAALLAGAIYNIVAIRTRSLPACILAHAVTNLLLGFYVMRTQQWGFW